MFNNSSSKRADNVDDETRTGRINFVAQQQKLTTRNFASKDCSTNVELDGTSKKIQQKMTKFTGRNSNNEFNSQNSNHEFTGRNSNNEFIGQRNSNNEFAGRNIKNETTGRNSKNEFAGQRNSNKEFTGGNSNKEFTGRNSTNEFSSFNVSLEKTNFDEYRRKTNELLLKKDAHISRLQERLNSFVENSNIDSTLHVIVAERDSLRVKFEQLENAYRQEKSSWLNEMENLRRNFDNREKILIDESSRRFDEKEQVSSQCQNNFRQQEKCIDCDYLRQEIDRYRRELDELNTKIVSNNKNLDKITKEYQLEITTKNDELKILNEKLTSTLIERDDSMKNLEKYRLNLIIDQQPEQLSVERDHLSIENQLLKRQLYETKEYFESMDVESEQQITVLANQIDEMHEILDGKQRDYVVLTQELLTKSQENETLLQKLKANETQSCRQQDIIESLREEFDKQKDKTREMLKERDELLIRNASLTHEVDFTKRQSQKEREEIHQQLTFAGRELDDYKGKLREKEMEIPQTNSNLTNLSTKLNSLEELLKQKQNQVDLLEQRLFNVKRTMRRNNSNLSKNSSKSEFDLINQSPMKKFRQNDEFNEFPKNTMHRLFPESDPERIARVFGSLLRLSTDEEQLVRNYLKQKSNQNLSAIDL